MHICYWQLIFLIVCMLLAVGPLNGAITLQKPLCERRLFSDCGVNNSSSSAQAASGTNLALSLMGAASLPAGIAVDAAGGHMTAVVAMFFWTVGISLSGIGETWWVVGLTIASVSSVFIFTSIMFFHIRHASVASRYAVWIAFLTFLRNFSSIFNIPLAAMISIESISLAWIYLIYGLVVGIPTTMGFFFLFPQRLQPQINEHDCNSPEHLQLIAQQPDLDTFSGIAHEEEEEEEAQSGEDSRISRAKQAVFSTIKICAAQPMFWILALRCAALVSICYFLTSAMASVARFMGDAEDVGDLLHTFNYLMAGLSISALLPGQLSKKWGSNGLAIHAIVAALFAAAWSALILFGRQWVHSTNNFLLVSSLAFGALIVWRVSGFAVVNLSTAVLLKSIMADPKLPSSAEANQGKAAPGVVLGALYTIGGVASMAVGGVLTRMVHNGGDEVMRRCVASCGALAVVLEIALLVVINCSRAEAEEEDERSMTEGEGN